MQTKTVCVYLGASSGNKEEFKDAVIKLGNAISDLDLTLIYGGSSLGMMGLLATTVKETGGKVIGVMTQHLISQEQPLTILDELIIVDTMQARKKRMQELGDTFIVMPGGLGTLEEAIETLNAIKIGEIQKKIGFLNINGYFNQLFAFITTCKNNGFMTHGVYQPEINTEVNALMYSLMKEDMVCTEESYLTI